MDIHKNARTTPHSRAAIVARITRLGESIKGVARAVGICPKTVRKWVARAHAGDKLVDRSSRPQHVPSATPAELVEHIERLRRQRWTSAEIAERLRLGRSTVAASASSAGSCARCSPATRGSPDSRMRPPTAEAGAPRSFV